MSIIAQLIQQQAQCREELQHANVWRLQRQRVDLAMSDDAYTLDWLHLHRRDEDDEITTLGRRWLTRMIWHLENRVETELRKQR